MAKRMSTAARMDRQRANGRLSRIDNGHAKRKERANRDARMVELLKKGTFPYTPSIQSWVSGQIGTPFTQLTEADVKALIK